MPSKSSLFVLYVELNLSFYVVLQVIDEPSLFSWWCGLMCFPNPREGEPVVGQMGMLIYVCFLQPMLRLVG
jgi:hypothetical protein